MFPGLISNPGPLTYESGALPIALRDPIRKEEIFCHDATRTKMSKIFSKSNKISQYSIFKLISENNLQKEKNTDLTALILISKR